MLLFYSFIYRVKQVNQDKRGSEGWKDPKYVDFEFVIVFKIKKYIMACIIFPPTF